MKKKDYVIPAIDVVEVEMESPMLSSSTETDSENSGEGSGSGHGTPDFTNGRRGGWGNLWD